MAKKSQTPPEGFSYQADILSAEEEQSLAEQISVLPLKEFEFHGYIGKRRTMSFGWHYDFGDSKLKQTEEIPAYLLPLRERAAEFAGFPPENLPHALVTEYSPGAAIGWHRDKAVFGEIVGISLLSPCTFRLRRAVDGGWERASIVAEPRSAYLLSGAARTEWEHSIPPVDALRYSITFRNLRER